MVTQRAGDRVGQRAAIGFREQGEDLVEMSSGRVGRMPAGQALGDRIHEIDHAGRVGCNHGLADRLQRDVRTLLLLEHLLAGILGRDRRAPARGDDEHRGQIQTKQRHHQRQPAGRVEIAATDARRQLDRDLLLAEPYGPLVTQHRQQTRYALVITHRGVGVQLLRRARYAGGQAHRDVRMLARQVGEESVCIDQQCVGAVDLGATLCGGGRCVRTFVYRFQQQQVVWRHRSRRCKHDLAARHRTLDRGCGQRRCRIRADESRQACVGGFDGIDDHASA